jgi:glucan phosphoethanolaminetransferase (alkaline phosphatase superfamily)
MKPSKTSKLPKLARLLKVPKFSVEQIKAWWSKFKMTPSRRALALLLGFIATALIPNFILANTEMYGGWSILAGILIPLGFYMVVGSAIRRTGTPVLLMVWVMVLCAFQIVLLFLYGGSIIGTDMFLNLFTTNPGESTELLINLGDAVATVVVIYAPVLGYAIWASRRRYRITKKMRKRFVISGLVIGALVASSLLAHEAASRASVAIMISLRIVYFLIYSAKVYG